MDVKVLWELFHLTSGNLTNLDTLLSTPFGSPQTAYGGLLADPHVSQHYPFTHESPGRISITPALTPVNVVYLAVYDCMLLLFSSAQQQNLTLTFAAARSGQESVSWPFLWSAAQDECLRECERYRW